MLDIDLNNCNYIAAIDEDQALQGVESIVSQNSSLHIKTFRKIRAISQIN